MRWAERFLGERRNAEDPTTALTAGDFRDWFVHGTPGGSGVAVTESSSMGLTAYLRAISLISSSIAGLPIRVFYKDSRERVTQRTVLDSPSPYQTPFEFWQTWIMHQLSWGNAYGFKIRDGAGTVREIEIIHPSRVTVAVQSGVKIFTVQGADGVEVFTPFDVAHLPFLSPDGRVGLSPLQACRTTLGAALAAEKVSESFFRNGARLSGVVNTTAQLTQQQAEQIKGRWRTLFQGPGRAGEVAVLDSGATFTPLALPPEDAQLLQSRSFGVSEIARIFGVPSHFLNDQEKATAWGSGIESMGIGYVVYTLLPRVKMLEQRITRELLPGGWETGAWEARIDLKGLLQGDSGSRAAFYRALMDMKAMTNHDIARLEDMDPPAGPPVFVMPSNAALVSADDLARVQALTGAPPAAGTDTPADATTPGVE